MRDLEKGVKLIQRSIHNFEDQHPKRAIELDDGSRTFCVPGGKRQDPLCYEFKKDAEGSYIFFIHNCSSDQSGNRLLLGKDFDPFELDGRIYGKTSIGIKFKNKEKLVNEEFLTNLFKAERSGNTEKAYQIITNYLLSGDNPGTIVASPEEMKLQKCCREIERMDPEKDNKKLIKRREQLRMAVVEKDRSFSSLERYGSSLECNFACAERAMASLETRRKLRYHTILSIVSAIKDKAFLYQKAEDAAAIIRHHEEVAKQHEETSSIEKAT
jgi:hypothetical protein